jgi:hypothetical protein
MITVVSPFQVRKPGAALLHYQMVENQRVALRTIHMILVFITHKSLRMVVEIALAVQRAIQTYLQTVSGRWMQQRTQLPCV